MKRGELTERIRRLIYNGMPPQDADVTDNLVNSVMNDAIAAAVKDNWVENIKIDGCECVNNSFFSTFSDIVITPDVEVGVYNFVLPSIPPALGKNEAVPSIRVVDVDGRHSRPVIMLSINQVAYSDNLPQMNGVYGWNEGKAGKLKSPKYSLLNHKAKVVMASTGSTDLESEINLPDEYLSSVMAYVMKVFSIKTAGDQVNDGVDSK